MVMQFVVGHCLHLGLWQQLLFDTVNAVVIFCGFDIENSFLDFVLGFIMSVLQVWGDMLSQSA